MFWLTNAFCFVCLLVIRHCFSTSLSCSDVQHKATNTHFTGLGGAGMYIEWPAQCWANTMFSSMPRNLGMIAGSVVEAEGDIPMLMHCWVCSAWSSRQIIANIDLFSATVSTFFLFLCWTASAFSCATFVVCFQGKMRFIWFLNCLSIYGLPVSSQLMATDHCLYA